MMTDAKPTVIDGEAVETSTEKTEKKNKKDSAKAKAKSSAAGAKPKRSDWTARILALAAIGGVIWLTLTRPDMTPLIEAQNALNGRLQALEEKVDQPAQDLTMLQQQLAELEQTVAALSTEVDALNEKVLNPANEPLVTKGEVELLQKQLQGLQGQLQQFAQRWQKALEETVQGITPPSAPADEADQPTVPGGLSHLEQKLAQMGQQLSELFGHLAEPTQVQEKAPAQVDPMTLQQWLLQVNAEWLLTGDVQQTRTRLHALEKAVQLSDLPAESKIALLRAIGQDLAYLEQYEQAPRLAPDQLDELRAWISSLPPPKPAVVDGQSTEAEDLMTRLKGLVEIRRRSEGLSTPEQLMAFDLVRQRALLLVDQLEWAYTSHNRALFEQTQARLVQLFEQALPHAVADLQAKLAVLPAPVVPQPLKSAEVL